MSDADAKAAKRRLQAEIAVTRDWLCVHFPHAFFGKGVAKVPLKIGVRAEVLATAKDIAGAPSEFMIEGAISDYTRGPLYLAVTRAGSPRINSEGLVCGEVTPEQAAYATARMRKIARLIRHSSYKSPRSLERLRLIENELFSRESIVQVEA